MNSHSGNEISEYVTELGKLRDKLEQIIISHEMRHHDGGRCDAYRCNSVAFFAHFLGLHVVPHSFLVMQIMGSMEAADLASQAPRIHPHPEI